LEMAKRSNPFRKVDYAPAIWRRTRW